LLAAFSLAVAINLVRGRRIACGCFGTVSQREISAFAVIRNSFFIAFAVVVVAQSPATLSVEAISGRTDGLSQSDGLAMLLVGTIGALALAIAQEAAAAGRARRLLNRSILNAR
jgi:hypothetical protein